MIINTTLDRNEVAKFSDLADSWWDPNGACAPLHILNPLRFNYVERFCSLKNLKVLDLGCGAGILSETLAKSGAKVTAIDANKHLIDAAAYHASLHNHKIEYYNTTLEYFLTKNPDYFNYFDIVVCMEMLEHVLEPQNVINLIKKVLKKNGHFFLSTINRTPKAYALGIFAAEYLLKILPKGTHDYNKLIKPSELAEYVRNSSMSLIDIQGVNFDPIFKQATFTNNVNINYLVAGKNL